MAESTNFGLLFGALLEPEAGLGLRGLGPTFLSAIEVSSLVRVDDINPALPIIRMTP